MSLAWIKFNLLHTVLRLITASILGAIIGYQRERINKPAGLKTHTIVALSSALIMLLGEYMFSSYPGVDPTRLGAQVINGIGFLGAGAILKEGLGVRGLTTAASIWTVSCIGLACGAGYYTGAIAATILVLTVLYMVRRVEKYIHLKKADENKIYKDYD